MKYLSFVLVALLIACGGDTPVSPVGKVALSLSVAGGDGQTDTVTRALKLPLVAQTADLLTAAPVQAVVLNWFRISGTDTVFSGVSITDIKGQAKFQWSLLPRAGDQSVVAWALDENGQRTVHVSARATALPDQPSVLVVRKDSIAAWLGDTLSARVLGEHAADQYGNNVPDARMTLTAPAGWPAIDDTAAVVGQVGLQSVGVVAGEAQASVKVTVLRDLRKLVAWKTSYSCGDTAMDLRFRDYDFRSSSGVVDSVQFFPSSMQWNVWSTARQIQHSDKTGLWDTTTVLEVAHIDQQRLSGDLQIPYLSIHYTDGKFARRADFENGQAVYLNDSYTGGNACLLGWQKGEPFGPYTMRK